MQKKNYRIRFQIGIDEVGRGALAGPVVVAGVLSRRNFHYFDAGLGQLRDSKKLSPKKRVKWFRYLTKRPDIAYAVARSAPAVIDRINVSRAANRAALQVYKKLLSSNKLGEGSFFASLDAGLSLPDHILHCAIVKGDEKIKLIAAASIIAKVHRDRLMCRLHKKDPRYRFDAHKGYGTKLHVNRIKKFGYSAAHRRSFILR